MKVLITGAAGFIGSHLVRRISEFANVVGVDDFSTGVESNLEGADIEFHTGSILDFDLISRSMIGCDAVVHLAARPSVPRSLTEPLATHEANTTGTLNILEAARHNSVQLVVVASSSSVYGANPNLPKSEVNLPMPLSPYAVSKLATEQYALAWQSSFGLKTLAFRFFNVFGPRQLPDHAYAAVIPAFLHAALSGRELVVNGDGLQTRDFTYVGTLCDIIAESILRNVSFETPVNLAFGTRTSLVELVGLIEEISGTTVQVRHVDARQGDVRHSQADNQTLRHLFPGITPINLREGLAITAEWMRKYVLSK